MRCETGFGNPEDVDIDLQVVDRNKVVFIAGVDSSLRDEIVTRCLEKGIICFVSPKVSDVVMAGAEHMQIFRTPIMHVCRAEPSPEYLFIKRVFNIVGSLIYIIVAGLIMLITALAIKICDGGPVIYKQVRLTQRRRKFQILNHRWMQVVHELHKIQARIRWIIGAKYTIFRLPSDFRHSTAGFAGVFAA